ncbi:hypothetical protein A3D08_02425 [Candidatus Roizmanbacteria bacterium RIFCSPHIGHO2_02_FULL_43_11]|nr:MAG: hypothetical protein A3D08_02425 [Candidatus Roizmanbacteria bacterium RIFCSPHIGHO2_02_FULL_43_11]
MFMQNLRHNMQYFNNYEIVIVDDASNEHIKERVHDDFPNVTVIENQKNLGFGPTMNIGVNHSQGNFLLFLNSDVRLIRSLPVDTLKIFHKDEKLFALSFRQIEKDGNFTGKNTIFFKNGFPQHSKVENMHKGLNAWAEGGSCIIKREYFEELGGFNELLEPFYWEDNDLSFRAYSRGWHVLFEPHLCVEHHHESTTRKYFSKSFIQTIAFKNQCIFTWCNITDRNLLRQHIRYLPKYIISNVLSGNIFVLKGCIRACTKMRAIHEKRRVKSKQQVRSDQEVLSMLQVHQNSNIVDRMNENWGKETFSVKKNERIDKRKSKISHKNDNK